MPIRNIAKALNYPLLGYLTHTITVKSKVTPACTMCMLENAFSKRKILQFTRFIQVV